MSVQLSLSYQEVKAFEVMGVSLLGLVRKSKTPTGLLVFCRVFTSPATTTDFPEINCLLCITEQKYSIDPVCWSGKPSHKSRSPEQICWSAVPPEVVVMIRVSKERHILGSHVWASHKDQGKHRKALWLIWCRKRGSLPRLLTVLLHAYTDGHPLSISL